MKFYTVEQVGELLQVSRETVYGLIRTQQLKSLKIGHLRRITEAQLAEFVEDLEGTAA